MYSQRHFSYLALSASPRTNPYSSYKYTETCWSHRISCQKHIRRPCQEKETPTDASGLASHQTKAYLD
jgi:hypothetical protein